MTGGEFFVDTGAWFPLARPTHPQHGRLANTLRALVVGGRRPVTTNLVVAEAHALLLSRTPRRAALAFLREVRRPPIVVVTSDPALEGRAQNDWLERFDDQSFSYTDAVSFTVMSDRGIRDALAMDRHFATAGFTLLT